MQPQACTFNRYTQYFNHRATMIVGIPKEIKSHENRIAITPGGVNELKKQGHQVIVETEAGTASGFSDEDFTVAGAEIRLNAADVWSEAELILKVKEPIEQEYELAREGQTIFTYFHFASNKALTVAMQKKQGCLYCLRNRRIAR